MQEKTANKTLQLTQKVQEAHKARVQGGGQLDLKPFHSSCLPLCEVNL
jgi:hypothetical protein